MKNQELQAFVSEKVKELLAMRGCCADLKAVCQKWLDAVGTDQEADANRALITELEEDVCSIDDLLAFCSSEAAANVMGAETAQKMKEQAEKAKAAGATTCICPACTAGKAILDRKAELL